MVATAASSLISNPVPPPPPPPPPPLPRWQRRPVVGWIKPKLSSVMSARSPPPAERGKSRLRKPPPHRNDGDKTVSDESPSETLGGWGRGGGGGGGAGGAGGGEEESVGIRTKRRKWVVGVLFSRLVTPKNHKLLSQLSNIQLRFIA